MKSCTPILTALPLFALLINGHVSYAQTATKKPPHKATASNPDKNRVVRKDLGFSYIAPTDYNEREGAAARGYSLYLEGPRTGSSEIAADGHTPVSIVTAISAAVIPTGRTQASDPVDSGVSASDEAKQVLKVMNSFGKRMGNLLNYQNSARIQVAGQNALAILAETSFQDTQERDMVRLIRLDYGGKTYIFVFQTLDAEFETRVTAFEAFMNSVKLLQPDVTPDQKKGPIEIKIDH